MTCDTCGRQVRVQLFGRFSVSLGDETLIDDGWPRRKAAAVLKLLALQPGRAMHRDRIADTLWPDLDGDAAASNLRKNLHRLRSCLPESMSDIVHRSGALIELDPDVWIDVVAFREAAEAALADGATTALDAALALYAGDLLEADSHEPWTETPREGLRSLHLRVLLASAARHERDGEPEMAARRYEAAAVIDPLREESHRGLMRALNAVGDRVGALRQYEVARAVLADQIAVEPARDTQALAREIEQQRLADAPPPMPEVRYATTTDGLRIAWHAFGEGPTLVVPPYLPWSHLQVEWDWAPWRAWLQGIGRGRRVVRYDGRGLGLSQRDASDVSIEAQVRDLEAVADALGGETFDLLVPGNTGPCAITYVTRHPERVGRMICMCSWADGPTYGRSFYESGIWPMMENQYDLYCDSLGKMAVGEDVALAADNIAWLKTTPHETLLAYTAAMFEIDATPMLSAVTCPVLVLWRGPDFVPDLQYSRELAAGLPDARLIEIVVPEYSPAAGDIEPACAAIDEFLCEPDATPPLISGDVSKAVVEIP